MSQHGEDRAPRALKDSEKYHVNDFYVHRSETERRYFLVRLAIEIHGLLVDIRDSLRKGEVAASSSPPLPVFKPKPNDRK